MAFPVITLLTDFGIQDAYVAAMKGILLGICPKARLVDVTHMVAPQDIASGAYIVKTYWRFFPAGTVHLAVVDPGVGTDRAPLAVRAAGHTFVGPDNGLFSWVLKETPGWEARRLVDPSPRTRPVSATFHGRDVFAPAAARLAGGASFEAQGPLWNPLVAPWVEIRREPGLIQGEVIHLDGFGNAITNIREEALAEAAGGRTITIEAGSARIRTLTTTYGDGMEGEVLALIGSSGHLEISVNRGSAARRLGLLTGSPVTVRFIG